jgi:protein-S-isoprenylcysteine O-methyltransferase Ste14
MNERHLKREAGMFGWAACPLFVALVLAHEFLEGGDNLYLRGAALAAFAAACNFVVPPFFLLKRHGRVQDGTSYMQTTAVVDQGVYAVVRHPQYLGYMLLAVGFVLLSQNWVTLLLGAIIITLLYLQAVEEERFCRAKLGAEYSRYLDRVPRFNFLLGIVRLVSRLLPTARK